MMTDPLLAQLEHLAQEACEALQCTLWGVELQTGRSRSHLRVFIDKSDGMTVDLCAELSRQLSDSLDVHNPISTAYTLEVSSPGIHRRFFKPYQYQAYIDRTIVIRLYDPLQGRRKLQGPLIMADESQVQLCDQALGEIKVSYQAIQKAFLYEDF